jgi:hypothetical protein
MPTRGPDSYRVTICSRGDEAARSFPDANQIGLPIADVLLPGFTTTQKGGAQALTAGAAEGATPLAAEKLWC